MELVATIGLSMLPHQRADSDILIVFRPMHANPFADQSPLHALRRSRIAQTGKPFQQRRNFPPIGKNKMHGGFVERDVDYMKIKFNGRSAHAIYPTTPPFA
jgi:hypothetical protein